MKGTGCGRAGTGESMPRRGHRMMTIGSAGRDLSSPGCRGACHARAGFETGAYRSSPLRRAWMASLAAHVVPHFPSPGHAVARGIRVRLRPTSVLGWPYPAQTCGSKHIHHVRSALNLRPTTTAPIRLVDEERPNSVEQWLHLFLEIGEHTQLTIQAEG